MEPLLVRAARREPVERTPVWFMRQAGRSLPEYRAIRERHGFFEVAGTPELCAEVTLQPVRRHGVDAAVMFADIMSPVLGMGVARRARRGRRAGRRAADRVGGRRRAAARDRPGGVGGADPRGGADRPRRARARAGRRRLLRRAVHRRGLPRRGPAEPRLRAHEVADVRRAGGLARADGAADGAVLPLRRREGGGRRRRDPAVRLLGRRALRRRTTPSSSRRTRPGSSRRSTCRRSTSAPGASTPLLALLAATGGDVLGLDWRVPLDAGWEAAGDDKGVQGNLDPALLLGPWERIEAGALDVLARAGGRPGTSSTSVTASCRRPTRTCSAGSSSSSTHRRSCA